MENKHKMEHNEKAKELLNKFYQKQIEVIKSKRLEALKVLEYDIAKECAIIAVEFARENPLNTKGYNEYLDNTKSQIELL